MLLARSEEFVEKFVHRLHALSRRGANLGDKFIEAPLEILKLLDANKRKVWIARQKEVDIDLVSANPDPKLLETSHRRKIFAVDKHTIEIGIKEGRDVFEVDFQIAVERHQRQEPRTEISRRGWP